MRLFVDLYDESIKLVMLDNSNRKHFAKYSMDDLEALFNDGKDDKPNTSL